MTGNSSCVVEDPFLVLPLPHNQPWVPALPHSLPEWQGGFGPTTLLWTQLSSVKQENDA